MKFLYSVILSTAALLSPNSYAGEKEIIRISTDNTDLVLEVGPNKRVYQTYLGPKLLHESDIQNLSWNKHAGADGAVSTRGWEIYSTSGNEDFLNRRSVSPTLTETRPHISIMSTPPETQCPAAYIPASICAMTNIR